MAASLLVAWPGSASLNGTMLDEVTAGFLGPCDDSIGAGRAVSDDTRRVVAECIRALTLQEAKLALGLQALQARYVCKRGASGQRVLLQLVHDHLCPRTTWLRSFWALSQHVRMLVAQQSRPLERKLLLMLPTPPLLVLLVSTWQARPLWMPRPAPPRGSQARHAAMSPTPPPTWLRSAACTLSRAWAQTMMRHAMAQTG